MGLESNSPFKSFSLSECKRMENGVRGIISVLMQLRNIDSIHVYLYMNKDGAQGKS